MASCCFVWKYAQKILVFSGVPFPVIAWPHLSVPLNCQPVAYYREGQDHSPPKACFYLRSPAVDWLSQYYKYTVAKQIGGGGEWVELFITLTRGMGEPTYGLVLSLIASWWSICEACSVHQQILQNSPQFVLGRIRLLQSGPDIHFRFTVLH